MVNYILSTTWQKQLMASDHNLIDFSDATEGIKGSRSSTGAAPPTETSGSVAPNKSTSGNLEGIAEIASKQQSQGQGTNKPNKSLFEITRVESNHGGSIGGEDSEMDDSVASSTSVLEQISKELDTEKKEITLTIKTKLPDKDNLNNTNVIASISNTTDQQITVQQSNIAINHQLPQNQQVSGGTQSKTQIAQPAEPSSRFRIVKIAKQIPYERGTWMVNDFNDTQKQQQENSADTAPSSPAVKRNRNPASDNAGVTSPTEQPAKTKSSEFLAQNLSNMQSRGSSYNTTGDRRSSVER